MEIPPEQPVHLRWMSQALSIIFPGVSHPNEELTQEITSSLMVQSGVSLFVPSESLTVSHGRLLLFMLTSSTVSVAGLGWEG